jgi:hypothetical protein
MNNLSDDFPDSLQAHTHTQGPNDSYLCNSQSKKPSSYGVSLSSVESAQQNIKTIAQKKKSYTDHVFMLIRVVVCVGSAQEPHNTHTQLTVSRKKMNSNLGDERRSHHNG